MRHRLSFYLMFVLGICLCFPATTAKPAAAGSWRIVFDEEFEGQGTLPNSTRWNIVDAASTINNELEYYTPSSMWLWDGQLNIKSEQRQMGGRDYTSGMIVSVPQTSVWQRHLACLLAVATRMQRLLWLPDLASRNRHPRNAGR
jgi:hypothetical protein